MGNEWDEYAADWDLDEDVVHYAEHAYDSLLALPGLSGLDNLNILDFGCGTGSLTEKLAGHAHRVVGLDTSPAMLAALAAKGLTNVVTISDELTAELVENHPELQSGFDLITASSVCAFLPDYEKVLGLLKSLLVPGGWFVQWDWRADAKGAQPGLTEAVVQGGLARAGFAAISTRTIGRMVTDKGRLDVLMAVGRNN